MTLKLKLQYFVHLMRRVDSLEASDAGRDWGQEERGTTEDEMAGWHHWLYGHESEWTPGVGDGQGGLACCNSCGPKELNTTERLNWKILKTWEFNFLLLARNTDFLLFFSHWVMSDSLWPSTDSLDSSTPGSLVLHDLPEFVQIHGHWVSDSIQPSYPFLPPSLFALNLSQHQGLFQWAGSLHQVATILEL